MDSIIIPTMIPTRFILTVWATFHQIFFGQLGTKLVIWVWTWIFAGFRNWIQKQVTIKWATRTIVWNTKKIEFFSLREKKLTNAIFGAWTICQFCFVKFDTIDNTFTISFTFGCAFLEFIIKQLNTLKDLIRVCSKYLYGWKTFNISSTFNNSKLKKISICK